MRVVIDVPEALHNRVVDMGLSHDQIHKIACEMALNPISGEWIHDMRMHELNMEELELRTKKYKARLDYEMIAKECDTILANVEERRRKLSESRDKASDVIREGKLISFINHTILSCEYNIHMVEDIAKKELQEISRINPDFDLIKHAYQLKKIYL